MKVVIAIPTVNKLKLFKQSILSVLVSLSESTYKNFDITILVLLNSNCKFTKSFVAELAEKHSLVSIKISVVEQLGIPYVRNSAIDYAKTKNYDALIFIDDDVVVYKNWFDQLIDIYIQDHPRVIWSNVYKKFPSYIPKLLVDLHNRPSLESYRYIKKAATDNLFLDRSIFSRFRFNTNMRFTGGSDSLFIKQVVDSGNSVLFIQKYNSCEIQTSDRFSFIWIFKRYYRYGSSGFLVNKLNNYSLFNHLSFMAFRFVSIVINLIKYSIRGRPIFSAIQSTLNLTLLIGYFLSIFGLTYDEYKVN